VVVVGLIGWAVTATDWGNTTLIIAIVVNSLAKALFSDYAVPFEILSLLLLAAIIGAIYLARRPEDDEKANS
jgi:NADH:ubiquinone oxidoreductase subunit 6 (subunit J)